MERFSTRSAWSSSTSSRLICADRGVVDLPASPTEGSRVAGCWRLVPGAGLEQIAHFAGEVIRSKRFLNECCSGVKDAVVHGGVFGIGGHIKNGKVVAYLSDLCDQLPALDARHNHIGQKQVNRVAFLFDDLNG